jgi:hydrogenase expression/formation protein HypD
MKYVDEFRNPQLARKLARKITQQASGSVRVMMGGGMIAHVVAQVGLRALLPEEIALIPGPGCPRCVTPARAIDRAIAISEYPNTIVAIFGGMMMIPGSSHSLEDKKAEGYDIRPVYSCLDGLRLAHANPNKNVVFVGLGYETTSPTVASTILEAHHQGVENFYITNAHLRFTSVFRALFEDVEVTFDGLLLPGPVTTVTGSDAYDFIPERYHLPSVITGLETCDILQSITMVLTQIEDSTPHVEVQYSRCVNPEGNALAIKRINEVFEIWDSPLRGFGVISRSGMRLRSKYEHFDAEKIYDIHVEEPKQPQGCLCVEVLRGYNAPTDCPFYGQPCTPTHPFGACMVSPQGTCGSLYRSHARA